MTLSELAVTFDFHSPARCESRRNRLLVVVRKGDFKEAFTLLTLWEEERWLGNGYTKLVQMVEELEKDWPRLKEMP